MQITWRAVAFLTLIAITVSLPMLSAQQKSRDLLDVLPSVLGVHAAALGNRIRVPGKERTVLTGSLLTVSGASASIRVVAQLPNMVRLDGLRADGAPVVFDGNNSVFTNSRIEEQLLEIFSSDTAEGMLVSVKAGSAATLVGRRVLEVIDGAPPGSFHRYDIFEVAGLVRSSATTPDRLKRYYFDSETGLLAKTRYFDETFSPPIDVEVLFSDWRREGDSVYAGRIERKENGHPIFSLTQSSIVASPRQDPTSFAHTEPKEE
jgi:hypothetical protein